MGPERHSRQVLCQTHGLPAVVEGIQVRGEEDAAASEEQLDVHSHVVCGWQVQTGSDRGLSSGPGWHVGGTVARPEAEAR